MIQALPELNREDIGYDLDSLAYYTNQAKAAVPILLTMLSNTPANANLTNRMIRSEILSTLKRIDPTAAKEITQ